MNGVTIVRPLYIAQYIKILGHQGFPHIISPYRYVPSLGITSLCFILPMEQLKLAVDLVQCQQPLPCETWKLHKLFVSNDITTKSSRTIGNAFDVNANGLNLPVEMKGQSGQCTPEYSSSCFQTNYHNTLVELFGTTKAWLCINKMQRLRGKQ